MTSPLLEIDGLSLAFGGLKAVDNFRLEMNPGDVQGLIGPNGAGKTTIFNLITGVYRPDSGAIRLKGKSIAGLRPHKIARAGIARTFQNIRLFSDLSVCDNVRVACHLRAGHHMAGALFRTARARRDESAIRQHTEQLLTLFNLHDRRHELARNLAYGDQRRLEIARAIATDPAVLLLDEPAAGMNSQEKRDLATLIRRLREEFRLTMLLIDHDVGLIMDICATITVLDYGQIIATGTPEEVQNDPKVIAAYLGEPA